MSTVTDAASKQQVSAFIISELEINKQLHKHLIKKAHDITLPSVGSRSSIQKDNFEGEKGGQIIKYGNLMP